MKLKKIILTTLLGLGLTFSSRASPDEGLRFYGKNYQMTHKGVNYAGKRCTSYKNKVDGWCIVDQNKDYVADPELYSKLSMMFEVNEDTKLLKGVISSSEKTFNQSLYVQLGINAAKFYRDNASGIEGTLLSYIALGGASASKGVQVALIKKSFIDKQQEFYSGIQNKLKEVENLSQLILDGELSEQELKDLIKESFDHAYEYQIKLAASELKTAKKLMNKENKTQKEYQRMWNLTLNGLSRGEAAAAYFNEINKANTIGNSAKIIFNRIKSGSGADYLSDLEFIAENPDFEKAQRVAEETFARRFDSLNYYTRYWDIKDDNSNASRMLPIIEKVREEQEQRKEIRKQQEQQRIEQAVSKMERKQKEPIRKKSVLQAAVERCDNLSLNSYISETNEEKFGHLCKLLHENKNGIHKIDADENKINITCTSSECCGSAGCFGGWVYGYKDGRFYLAQGYEDSVNKERRPIDDANGISFPSNKNISISFGCKEDLLYMGVFISEKGILYEYKSDNSRINTSLDDLLGRMHIVVNNCNNVNEPVQYSINEVNNSLQTRFIISSSENATLNEITQELKKINREPKCASKPKDKEIMQILYNIYVRQLSEFSNTNTFPTYSGDFITYVRNNDIFPINNTFRACNCDLLIWIEKNKTTYMLSSGGGRTYYSPWVAELKCNLDDDSDLEVWTINDEKIYNHISED